MTGTLVRDTIVIEDADEAERFTQFIFLSYIGQLRGHTFTGLYFLPID